MSCISLSGKQSMETLVRGTLTPCHKMGQIEGVRGQSEELLALSCPLSVGRRNNTLRVV